MSAPGGYILNLSEERQVVFEERDEQSSYAEAVEEFAHSRNAPLVCFVLGRTGEITHMGEGRRGLRAGDQQRRLNVENLWRLRNPISAESVVWHVPQRFKKALERKIETGGLLSPKLFEAVISAVSELAPDAASALRSYRQDRRTRIRLLSKAARGTLALQKEAVSTALNISGIDRKDLSGWDYDAADGPTSFLAGLPKVRLREDQIVVNDLQNFPGYQEIAATQFATTVFENAFNRLTVILANRLPLEEQTGADLIYYNETLKCFVMVQYKAMKDEEGEAVYRFPDQQLTLELERMEAILAELKKCPYNDEADGYRLNENPFFLKICPRIVFDPDNIGLSKGMYLPLGYWEAVSNHPGTIGPRGGRQISFQNVRRYMDNTQFATIVSGGWVGTNIAQSELIAVAIRSTLETGRAAVIAINSEIDDRHRRPATDGGGEAGTQE